MIADRLVARAVARWLVLVVVAAAALAWLATAVEAGVGPGAALAGGALRVPGLLVPLLPVLCALGAGLAAARLQARGERVALEASGRGPLATGRAALGVGLLAGILGWGVHAVGVPRAESRADALLGAPDVAWVWVEAGAVRLADGLGVRLEADAVVDVGPWPLDAPTRERALARQSPRRAGAADLRGTTAIPAVAERHARLARVVASGLLALLGWLPLSRRPTRQAGLALAAGLTWASVDLVLRLGAAQGRLPVAAGAWLGLCVLAVLVGALAVRSYSTTSQ